MTDTPNLPSPLDEATPDSIEDIFNKDPLKLTEQDLVATVEYFRRARETFLKQDAAKVPRSAKGKGASTGVPKQALDAKLTLDDLDL